MNISKELINKVKAHINNNQPNFYWDYDDELSTDNIETILDDDGLLSFENELIESNLYYMLELKDEAIKEYISAFREEFVGELGEEVVDNDDFKDDFEEFFSDDISINLNVEDLIRQQRDEIFFYNTGLEIEEPRYDEGIKTSIDEIKEMLSINNNEFDERIYELIQNAFYGGDLVVYFKSNIMNMLEMKKSEKESIKFSGDVSIAIIDTNGGSGFDTVIQHEFILPFDFENIFFEKSIKYNYTYAVCGMVSDWCEDTVFELVDTKSDKEITNNLKASLSVDKELSKKWKETGECTFGDMDYTRHGNKNYINDYPCGNKCLKCGTFWID